MSAIPADIVALDDYARHAATLLRPEVRAYVDGAGADGITHRANLAAWGKIRLMGRALRDMAGATTKLSLLGQGLEHPLILAPVAYHGLAHDQQEHATALGAAATGTVMTVSTQAGLPLAEIAAQAQGPLWFQLYMQHRRADTLTLVRRAEEAGYLALMVTVDAPVNGLRNDEQRAGFTLPEGLWARNLEGLHRPVVQAQPARAATFLGLLDGAPTWEDIAWLRKQTQLPILLKGITNPADARLAVEIGAEGVVVSNHGGRVLDSLPATAEILPLIAAELRGQAAVLCDGGIRRGTDVLKALALGADAVMIGRPQIHALSVAGAAGVAHMLTILRAELEVAMALTGCRTLSEITPEVLWPHDRP